MAYLGSRNSAYEATSNACNPGMGKITGDAIAHLCGYPQHFTITQLVTNFSY